MKKAAEDFPTAPGDGAQETTASPAAGWAPWEARLALRFDRDGDTTRLVGRSHFGPLRVQKALYPEQPAVCHAVVVHPPGGVVGGDRLFIDIDAGAGAHALLTTPGATKWYRASQLSASTGRPGVSSQVVRLAAGAGANLEWLPQETIFYNGAQVRLDTEIALGAGAQYIGCEVLCFGRTWAPL
jgi:urease accessory protein